MKNKTNHSAVRLATQEKPAHTGSSHSSNWLMIGAGNMLAASVISAALLGYGTDVWLDTAPWFMLIFISVGFIGSLLKLRKMLL